MLQFLSEQVSSLVAFAAALAFMFIALKSKDKSAKVDLRGAVYYLLGYLVAHAVALILEASEATQAALYTNALSYLLLSFALIRGLLGLVLWGMRARRGFPTPKILRDVIDGILYLVALAIVLRATLKVDLGGLVATSAVLSVVIGLALQETLGNLFAGLSLQLEPPFRAGDWIIVGEQKGMVLQVGWRATRILTARNESITVPNSVMGKESVINLSQGAEGVAKEILIQIDYAVPPTAVKRVCSEVVSSHPKVSKTQPPLFHLTSYAESGIEYRIRFFTSDRASMDGIADEILSMLWYRLGREGFTIPYPTRTLHVVRPTKELSRDESSRRLVELLTEIDFLRPLGEEGLLRLAAITKVQLFGRGEIIIRQGDAGEVFYVIVSGEVSVRNGIDATAPQLARLRTGGFFGEMSLLNGDPRSATVIAEEDSSLLCVGREAFSVLFQENAELAAALSQALAERSVGRAKAAGAEHTTVLSESRRILGRLKELFLLKG